MRTFKNLNPEMGMLLSCWFPNNETPDKIGKKFRPVFFFGQNFVNGELMYYVAFGTSQLDDYKVEKNGGDFLVTAASDGFQFLQKDTRFNFNNIKAVPATETYFTVSRNDRNIQCSMINGSYLQVIGEAITRSGAIRRLQSLGFKP